MKNEGSGRYDAWVWLEREMTRKIYEVKSDRRRKNVRRGVGMEFGHGDKFPGLAKMSLGQENRSERVREDWIRTRLNLNPNEFE